MRTGVSYQPSINPRHIRSDLEGIREIGCSDLLVAFQENDYVYLRGKIEFVPEIARELGLRTIGIFWGGLNLFGGGRSSHFLLWHPEAHQLARDGSWRASGCYSHPVCIERVRTMIAHIAELGYEGYFVDEPSQEDCYCDSCAELYREWYGAELREATVDELPAFRQRCVSHYLRHITDHVKARHPQLETHCCLMPVDRDCWAEAAAIPHLDSLGTDLYWANDDRDLDLMREPVRAMATLCRDHGKMHQEWFQCWGIERGNEERAAAQGRILIEERPDAIYTWAYNGQLGTSETCEDPERAWALTAEVLREASALRD